MSEFDEQTLDMLRNSGWSEHRYVPIDDSVANSPILFPLARSILTAFDGLKIGACGPGVDFAASNVEFDSETVNGFGSLMNELRVANGRLFCPLGYAHNDHQIVVIDEEGRLYTFFDSLELMGPSFEEGMQNILAGRNPRSPDK